MEKFTEDSDVNTLFDGFDMIVDACRYSDEDVDLVNSLRFIFLCKFIASLRTIENSEWQLYILSKLSSAMFGHVDHVGAMQNENENVKKFVKALS